MTTLKTNGIPGMALIVLLIMALAMALAGPAFGQVKERASTEELLQNLSHKDAKIRGEAAWALGKSGDTRAIDPLIEALEDNNSDVREWAVLALAKMGRPSIGPLSAAMQSKGDTVRWQAAAALGLINDSNATETLSNALQSNNSTVRYWAAAALGQIKDNRSRSRDALISALGDLNETAREEAGWALRSVEGAGAADLLIKLLTDGDPNRRMGAAQALGDLADLKAAAPLIEALQDLEAGVRSEAACSLGRLGDSQATMPLIGILGDPEERVRREGIKALTAIGRPATDSLILALNESDNSTQEAASQALGNIGEERSVQPLIWAFKNGDSNVRHAAVTALAEINRSLAVTPFIQILGDPNLQSDLRADAAFALGEMDDARAKEPLIFAMANDRDSSVRMKAAQALKSIGGVSVPEYSI